MIPVSAYRYFRQERAAELKAKSQNGKAAEDEVDSEAPSSRREPGSGASMQP
jgi:hypothetical protein